MTSRYLGLVVVPGEFITKIEAEEFASQVKAGGSKYADLVGGVA
jgi:N-alpha-acetyltransferase 38, NatC auxiliary subunit